MVEGLLRVEELGDIRVDVMLAFVAIVCEELATPRPHKRIIPGAGTLRPRYSSIASNDATFWTSRVLTLLKWVAGNAPLQIRVNVDSLAILSLQLAWVSLPKLIVRQR